VSEEIKEQIKETQLLNIVQENNEISKIENIEVTNEIKEKEEDIHQLQKRKKLS